MTDFPLALRAVYRGGIPCKVFPRTKLWSISDYPGLWKYVPHAHETALNQRPKAGTIVAKVFPMGGQAQARVFRQSDRPSKPRAL